MRRTVLSVLLLIGILAGPAHAALVWPSSTDWNAIQVNGGNLTDPAGPTPDTIDIRGDSTYAAGYWAHDGVNGYIFFRMRLDEKPSSLTSVWQFLLDTDSDSGIDWIVQLDESGDNRVELVATATEGSTFKDVTLSSTVSWNGATSTYAKFTDPTGDGSSFDGDNDTFLDLAVPWSSFSSATGLSTSSSFRIALSSSTTHSGINKDFPLGLGSGSSVADGFSDVINGVPEPGTWVLFAAGLALLILSRRARRRLETARALVRAGGTRKPAGPEDPSRPR
jgi:hypothetical protein